MMEIIIIGAMIWLICLGLIIMMIRITRLEDEIDKLENVIKTLENKSNQHINRKEKKSTWTLDGKKM